MLLYTAFDDEPAVSAKQLAQFDPFGNGYCNFTSGALRFIHSILFSSVYVRYKFCFIIELDYN